jgi:hypothetical protein
MSVESWVLSVEVLLNIIKLFSNNECWMLSVEVLLNIIKLFSNNECWMLSVECWGVIKYY